jgi:hypothetical protein
MTLGLATIGLALALNLHFILLMNYSKTLSFGIDRFALPLLT